MPPETALDLAASAVRAFPTRSWQVVSVATLVGGETQLPPEIRYHGKAGSLDIAHETAWRLNAKAVVTDFIRRNRLQRGLARARVYVCETGENPTHGPLISGSADVGVGYVIAPDATTETTAKVLEIAAQAGRRR